MTTVYLLASLFALGLLGFAKAAGDPNPNDNEGHDDDGHEQEPPPAPTLEEIQRELEDERKKRAAADQARVKATKEAEALRKKIKDREDAEAASKKSGGSTDDQSLAAAKEALDQLNLTARERDEARDQLARFRVDTAISKYASGKFHYPDEVPKLVDRGLISLDPETNEVIGVEKAVDRLLKDRPLLGTQKLGGGTPPVTRDTAPKPRDPARPGPRSEERSERDVAREQVLKHGNYY